MPHRQRPKRGRNPKWLKCDLCRQPLPYCDVVILWSHIREPWGVPTRACAVCARTVGEQPERVVIAASGWGG